MYSSRFFSIVLLCLSLPLLGPSVCARNQEQTRPISSKELLGDYDASGGYDSSSLKLASDGHYVQGIDTDVGNEDREIGGSYTFASGLIVLYPRYLIVGQDATPHDARTRTPISTPVTRFLTVRWGKRLYLLQQGRDEIPFCNAINLGEEPLWSPTPPPPLPQRFLMRKDDWKVRVSGQPQLPTQWRSYLLARPVTAKVIWVQKDASVVVNVGSANNIHVGMCFTNNRREYNYFYVVAVTPHQATLKSSNFRVRLGTLLSTRRARHARR